MLLFFWDILSIYSDILCYYLHKRRQEMCLQPVENYIYIHISYGLITAPQIKGKILKQKNISLKLRSGFMLICWVVVAMAMVMVMMLLLHIVEKC